MDWKSKLGYVAASAAIFLAFWQLLHLAINNFMLPSPLQVAITFAGFFANYDLLMHVLASLKRVIVGFLLGLAAGIALGFIAGESKLVRNLFTPIAETLRPIPPIAWIPLAILWFGIGDVSAFFLIFIAAFYPIFTNVLFGVKSIPQIYKQVGKNCKLGKLKFFRHISFPFALPYLFTGCKTSMGFAWMVVIAAEMISASQGLGYFIELNRVLLNTDKVIAAMLLIGVIGFALHKIISIIEKRTTAWSESSHE